MDTLEVRMLKDFFVSPDGISRQLAVKGQVMSLPLLTANSLIKDEIAELAKKEAPKKEEPKKEDTKKEESEKEEPKK